MDVWRFREWKLRKTRVPKRGLATSTPVVLQYVLMVGDDNLRPFILFNCPPIDRVKMGKNASSLASTLRIGIKN